MQLVVLNHAAVHGIIPLLLHGIKPSELAWYNHVFFSVYVVERDRNTGIVVLERERRIDRGESPREMLAAESEFMNTPPTYTWPVWPALLFLPEITNLCFYYSKQNDAPKNALKKTVKVPFHDCIRKTQSRCILDEWKRIRKMCPLARTHLERKRRLRFLAAMGRLLHFQTKAIQNTS